MTNMIENIKMVKKPGMSGKRLNLGEFGKNRLAVSGILLIAVLCTLALFAPIFAPNDPLDQKA